MKSTLSLTLALTAVVACAPKQSPNTEDEPVASEVEATQEAEPTSDEASPEPGEAAEAGAPENVEAPPVVAEPEPEPEPEPVVTAADGHGPLSPEARAIFWGSAEDPPPELLNATRPDLEGRHYLTCDENNLHLLYDRVANLGGGYAGVGTDQAYTFAGWQRPNLVWLTDYDPWVRHIHFAYRAFFLRAENIDAFRHFWSEEGEDEAEALIRETYPDRDDVDDIVFVYSEARSQVNRRLRRLRGYLNDADVPGFINDEETYTFVRGLVQADRVRPMIGNLLDDGALLANAEVGRELGVPIRVYYFSNAEDYWEYPDQFRENMWGSYFDERSLVIRTDAKKRRNGDYAYCMQPALNFQQWLRQDYVVEIDDIWPREHIDGPDHIPVRFLDDEPFDRHPDED